LSIVGNALVTALNRRSDLEILEILQKPFDVQLPALPDLAEIETMRIMTKL
jgi:hypothetical protein